MKLFTLIGVAAASFLGFANAAIINLDSTDSNNGETLMLGPGKYKVTFISDDYEAWNAWDRVTDCDTSGENCSRGWLNNTRITSSELGSFIFGNNGRFATASQALAATSPLMFTLSSLQQVAFEIDDFPVTDNAGGVSLNVEAVPVPAAALLFGSAAFGISAFRRRAV
ncbi:MAG: hypothetical protein AAF830_08680 [Pseudomonadota bacterium]